MAEYGQDWGQDPDGRQQHSVRLVIYLGTQEIVWICEVESLGLLDNGQDFVEIELPHFAVSVRTKVDVVRRRCVGGVIFGGNVEGKIGEIATEKIFGVKGRDRTGISRHHQRYIYNWRGLDTRMLRKFK